MKKTLPLLALGVLFCTSVEQPRLILPHEGELLISMNPEFLWHPAVNARSYYVEIAKDAGFSVPIDTTIFGDTSFVIAETLSLGTEYYWRVTARTSQGAESEPSEPARFKVKEGVELLTPGPSDSTAWPEFSWKPYPGASSYHLTVSRYADFRELYLDTTINSTSLELPDSLSPFTYFWRVQGLAGGNPVSSPSLVRRLVSYKIKDTYFPLYQGLNQTFRLVELKGRYILGAPEIWDTTMRDSGLVTVKVKSSFLKEGRLFYVFSDTMWDVGDSVAIHSDSVFSPLYFMSELYPRDSLFRSWRDLWLDLSWVADTLRLEHVFGNHSAGRHDSLVILRFPGKGIIEQRYYLETFVAGDTHSWQISKMTLLP